MSTWYVETQDRVGLGYFLATDEQEAIRKANEAQKFAPAEPRLGLVIVKVTQVR